MREYSKKPQNQSRTLDSNPRASKQAPIADILQAYKNGVLGRQPIQRENVEDEELLQTKTSGQAPANVILQRYKDSIQRYAPEEENDLLQGKFETTQCEEIDEEELLQGKFDSTSTTEQEPLRREEKPNNTGLPDNLKKGIENLSGYSMDDVQVHYNSYKPTQLQALAYTQGTDIHVAPGQEQYLAHEAWHVVQQKQGRVQPTMQLRGVNVNDNEGLEKEADVMENHMKDANLTVQKNIAVVSHSKPIHQMKFNFKNRIIKEDGSLDSESQDKMEKDQEKNKKFAKQPNTLKKDIYDEVKEGKPQEVQKQMPAKDDFEWDKSIDSWSGYDKEYEYDLCEKNKEYYLKKLTKDIIKYKLHKEYQWRSIGVAEYMTGDATGLALAATVDPSITLKVLTGDQQKANIASTVIKGPTFLKEDAVPSSFKQAQDRKQILISPTGSKEKYTGTRDRYTSHYNPHGIDKIIKPWNQETWAATEIIGKALANKPEEEKVKKSAERILLPESSDHETREKIHQYKDTLLNTEPCILLWGRTSGKKGGAHKELDSHPLMMYQLIQKISSDLSSRKLILIGDVIFNQEQLEGFGFNDILILSEYWNSPGNDFLKDRKNQHYFLTLLKEENDAISIGMRSGGLEATALLGMKTIFIDDLGNNAEGRMEFWAGEAARTRDLKMPYTHEREKKGPIPTYKRLATTKKMGNQLNSSITEKETTTLLEYIMVLNKSQKGDKKADKNYLKGIDNVKTLKNILAKLKPLIVFLEQEDKIGRISIDYENISKNINKCFQESVLKEDELSQIKFLVEYLSPLKPTFYTEYGTKMKEIRERISELHKE